jgi:hypothetical protein
MKATSIINAVQTVTKKWAKQRKAEERASSAQERRWRAMVGSDRESLKDIVFCHIEDAYDAVSDHGKLPAHARQLMYDVRRQIQDETDEQLNDSYFTQNLLPAYVRENPEAERWDIVFDARGHFHEPHTGQSAALGTLDVRRYLRGKPNGDTEFDPDDLFPTHGPKNRFGAILFIEKEGFLPLFQAVKLAERFDLAIMSTKGLSNVAARQLVDQVCGENEVPLFVLRDFDKAGFSIAGTLSRDTDRYSFEHSVQVVDLGLHLEDVEAWKLGSESFHTKASTFSMKKNLRRNGATEEEIDFIAGQRRRVELNAFRSADLIAFIESKLRKHGVKKVIPNVETLEVAYRRAMEIEHVKSRFARVKAEAKEFSESVKVPSLKRRVDKALRKDPTMPWDLVIANLAASAIDVS